MTKETSNTEIGKSQTQFGDFPNIESLAAEHDRVLSKHNELYDAGDEGDECERLNNRAWALRALIGATVPKSLSELQAIARIFQVEAVRDSKFECHIPGSARHLARTLSESVTALQAA